MLLRVVVLLLVVIYRTAIIGGGGGGGGAGGGGGGAAAAATITYLFGIAIQGSAEFSPLRSYGNPLARIECLPDFVFYVLGMVTWPPLVLRTTSWTVKTLISLQ